MADPNIADAIVISPYQVLLNGKTPGGVSLVIWDESDQSQTFEIFVDQDILGLSQKIREVFPNEPIRVEASKDLVMISGHASSRAVADANSGDRLRRNSQGRQFDGSARAALLGRNSAAGKICGG